MKNTIIKSISIILGMPLLWQQIAWADISGLSLFQRGGYLRPLAAIEREEPVAEGELIVMPHQDFSDVYKAISATHKNDVLRLVVADSTKDEHLACKALDPAREVDNAKALDVLYELETKGLVKLDVGRLARLIEDVANKWDDSIPEQRKKRQEFVSMYSAAISTLRTCAINLPDQMNLTRDFAFPNDDRLVYINENGLSEKETEFGLTVAELRVLLALLLNDDCILYLPTEKVPEIVTERRARQMIDIFRSSSSDSLAFFIKHAYSVIDTILLSSGPRPVATAFEVNAYLTARRARYYNAVQQLAARIASHSLYRNDPYLAGAYVRAVVESLSKNYVTSNPKLKQVRIALSFDFSEGDNWLVKIGDVGIQLREDGIITGWWFEEGGERGRYSQVLFDKSLNYNVFRAVNLIATKFPARIEVTLEPNNIELNIIPEYRRGELEASDIINITKFAIMVARMLSDKDIGLRSAYPTDKELARAIKKDPTRLLPSPVGQLKGRGAEIDEVSRSI